MPHTAVGRIPSGPPTFDHRAWTMASSNVSGTLQSPPNHNPLYSPQTIPVGPHYVPVQPPPRFMGQYAPPMTDTIQTPYSGAVPYSPSPYIAHTAHSSSVPYTQGHFHLGATCLHQLMDTSRNHLRPGLLTYLSTMSLNRPSSNAPATSSQSCSNASWLTNGSSFIIPGLRY